MFDVRWTAVLGLSLLGLSLSAGSASAFLAYVSNEKGNSISVIDTDKMETVATIKTGQRPRGIEVSHDGKLVYVALGDDDIIQVFDAKTFNSAGDLPSGPDPEQFTMDPAGKILYVANENDAMVTVLDLEKRASIGEVSVGIEPEGMTVSPDSKTLICTSETTSMVHFIDTTSRQIVGNLLVGSRPRFSAFKTDGSELWVSFGDRRRPRHHRSGDTATQADRKVRSSGSAIRGNPAGRHQYHQGRQARLRRSRARQSGRRGRWRHSRGLEISAGRPEGLARRLYAGREVSAGGQWRLERRLGHRRGALAGYQIHPGRRVALGYCVRPKLKIKAPAVARIPPRASLRAPAAAKTNDAFGHAPTWAGSNVLLPAAGVTAAPFLCSPCGVLVDPLRDIGLRGHHALLDRAVPGELQMLFLAIGGIGDGADGQDDFNQSALHTKYWLGHNTPNLSPRFRISTRISCLPMQENARAR